MPLKFDHTKIKVVCLRVVGREVFARLPVSMPAILAVSYAGDFKEILRTAQYVGCTVDGQDHHGHHGAAPNAKTSASQTSSGNYYYRVSH